MSEIGGISESALVTFIGTSAKRSFSINWNPQGPRSLSSLTYQQTGHRMPWYLYAIRTEKWYVSFECNESRKSWETDIIGIGKDRSEFSNPLYKIR